MSQVYGPVRRVRPFVPILILALIVLLFQNCGTAFMSQSSKVADVAGATDRTVLPYSVQLGGDIFFNTRNVDGLEIDSVVTEYDGAIEQRLQIRNGSAEPSKIVSEANVFDGEIESVVVLYGLGAQKAGSPNTWPDFTPLFYTPNSAPVTFAPTQGKSSSDVLPFFNFISSSGKSGTILAIGWTGEWALDVTPQSGKLRVKVRQRNFGAQLLPKESFRTPSVLVFPWTSEDGWQGGQNLFRRFMKSKILVHPHSFFAAQDAYASYDTNQSQLITATDALSLAGLPFKSLWVDAGWMTDPPIWADNPVARWWWSVGNDRAEATRFPNQSLAPVSDRVRSDGRALQLWFEPERISPYSLIYQNPQAFGFNNSWLMHGPDIPQSANDSADPSLDRIINLAIPEAKEWFTKNAINNIREHGVGIYRMDSNSNFLAYMWEEQDQKSEELSKLKRAGLTEAHYIANLYSALDAVRAEFPGLLIDNCASGGKRLDIEMLRRSVNLWRSDRKVINPTEQQGQSIGLSLWLPTHGAGYNYSAAHGADVNYYDLGSFLGSQMYFTLPFSARGQDPSFGANFWPRWKQLAPQIQKFSEYFLKDFYILNHLTPNQVFDQPGWLADESISIGTQFYDEQTGKSLLWIIRRPGAGQDSLKLHVKRLNPNGAYRAVDIVTNEILFDSRNGRDLDLSGLTVDLLSATNSAAGNIRLIELSPVN